MVLQPNSTHGASALPSRLPAPPNWRWLALPLLLVIVLLQIDTLTRHSLWNDEFITLRVISLDYADLIRNRFAASHVPGYFLALKAWTSLVGLNDATLRFPSALSTLLGILFIWRLGVHLYGPRAGLLVLALAGLNQIHVEQGGNARMYAPLFLASAAALYGLIHYLDRGRAASLLILVLAGIFGMSMQLLYVLVPLAAVLYIILRRDAFPTRVRPALLALLLPLLLAAPIVFYWFRGQDKLGSHHGYQMFGLDDAFLQTCIVFMGDTRGSGFKGLRYGRVVFVLAALLIAVYALWKSRRAPRPFPNPADPRRYLDLLLIWVGTPILVMAVGEVFSSGDIAGLWRYYVTQAPAAPLLLTAAALILKSTLRPRVVHAVAIVVVLMMSINTAGYVISPETGLREVAYYVREHRVPGEPVVVSRQRTRSLAFIYYAGFPEVPPNVPEDLDDPDTIAEWLHEFAAGNDRFWAVFYDSLKKDRLHRAIQLHPDLFEPVDDVFIYGETAVGLYRLN